MSRGDFSDVNWGEVIGAVTMSATVGVIRALYMVRKGRQFRWFDIMLEPALAVFGGMMMWAVTEVTPTPDLIQAVFTSLGAWGGPKTIQWLELHYFGGRRRTDALAPTPFTQPGDLGD
jgi:hypothetical protein